MTPQMRIARDRLSQRLRMVRRGGGPDDGRILLLSVGALALVAALIMVVASATAVHLDRKGLMNLADGAAAAAADAIDEATYFESMNAGDEASVPLTTESVQAAVREYLTDVADTHTLGVVSMSGETGSPDGRTAHVVLVAEVRPPLTPWAIPELGRGIEITATARATST